MKFELEEDLEFLSRASLDNLNYQQMILYKDQWEDLLVYLRQKGKFPRRNRGYSESNIRPLARRVHQVHEWVWEEGPVSLSLSPEQADQFLTSLNQDNFTKGDNEPYAEGSKRKFRLALEAYFRFQGIEWEPEIKFSEDQPSFASNPFSLDERERLLTTSLDYHSPPTYSNISPEERDRWKTHLAQTMGRPKQSIGPTDWEELNKCWKIPCLISTALDCGWRAAMVSRLETKLINLDEGRIRIPPEVAVKNDEYWEAELSSRSSTMLQRWLDQRQNRTKYDDSDHIWLNRKGNPYRSRTLNDLLSNLIEKAEIDTNGRRLTWHSIRHSTGMYVYDEYKDLGLVAEILRHSTLEAARKYAHPTPESKQEAIQSIQRKGGK